jgi:hypothetical protein
MYIYNNTCSVNNECQSGYSLYFPCVGSLTRGENACFDFYIVDNANKEEVDLREVDDITLNVSGRYNCNFGSYSYPENVKSLQVEKFSEMIYDIDFTNVINEVKLYIDIVDENHNLIESFLFDENLILDIDIEGAVGYFLKNSDNSILNLTGYDTYTYMFLGWNIEENDGDCDLENIYDYLINSKNLIYNIGDDCVVRAVYQKRREFAIQMASDNYDSSFVVDYMGEQTIIRENNSIKVLEGHDVKVTCVPNDVKPYKFVKWNDGYKNPYRVLNISGDDLIISLKAYCELKNDNIEYVDDIDASILNNFKTIYPKINDNIFVDSYYIDNIYINNCEIDILNEVPYVKLIEGGYIQILNVSEVGNLKLTLNNVGGDCNMYIDKQEVSSSVVEKNEFVFEFEGGIITLTGKGACIFGFTLSKEIIYDKGKCMLCFSSENTLNFHPGELVVEGGVIVNGNPYGISPVKFATVTNVAPLIIN